MMRLMLICASVAALTTYVAADHIHPEKDDACRDLTSRGRKVCLKKECSWAKMTKKAAAFCYKEFDASSTAEPTTAWLQYKYCEEAESKKECRALSDEYQKCKVTNEGCVTVPQKFCGLAKSKKQCKKFSTEEMPCEFVDDVCYPVSKSTTPEPEYTYDYILDTGLTPNTAFGISDQDKVAFAFGNALAHISGYNKLGYPVGQKPMDPHLAVILNGFSFTAVMETMGETELAGAVQWNGADDVVRQRAAAIKAAGGRIFMCANTAAAIGFSAEDLIEGIEIAPNGATVLIAQLQAAGTRFSVLASTIIHCIALDCVVSCSGI